MNPHTLACICAHKPFHTEIRPYMYETLMYLVGIHAQVNSAADPLVARTLSALVDEVADEALRCFRQVKRFGMGGMLRVSYLPYSTFSRSIGNLMNHRQLWKSNLCTRRSAAMLHPRRTSLCVSCITRFRRRMRAGLGTRICRCILTG